MTEIENSKIIKLGEFQVTSGKIIISDPCYDFKEGENNGIFDLNTSVSNVHNGKWNGYIIRAKYGDWGKRNFLLCAVHSKNKKDIVDILNDNSWEKITGVCVDSGQMSIVDSEHYKNDMDTIGKTLSEVNDDTPGEKWYSMICNITLNKKVRAGIIPNGVVSESGIGDGVYNLFKLCDKNDCVIGLKVNFLIGDNESNSENDDE
jgi:hypothetical protein